MLPVHSRYQSLVRWELKTLNSQKINDPMKKWAKQLNTAFSKEEVQMAKK
jgi:hypothetical protein